MKISIGISMTTINNMSNAGSGHELEYDAILSYANENGYDLPSPAQQIIDNNKIKYLKAIGAWGKIDKLHIFDATYTPSTFAKNFYLLNWKSPGTYTLYADAGKEPNWISGKGFKVTAASGKFLKTGFIPSIDGVNMKSNDASEIIGTFDIPASFTVSSFFYGGRTTSLGTDQTLLGNLSDKTLASRLFSIDAQFDLISQSDSNGHFHTYRTTSSYRVYRNGIELALKSGSFFSPSGSLPTVEQYIFGFNNNGSLLASPNDVGIKYEISGAAMDSMKIQLYQILNGTYVYDHQFYPTTISNGSYSIFCDPISIRIGGYNYFSYINNDGSQEITRLDDIGNKIIVVVDSGMAKDEHNSAAMCPIADNKLLITWTGHNRTQMYRAIYDMALNVVVGKELISAGGGHSYTVTTYINGRIFLFTRSNLEEWNFITSDDEGFTWYTYKTLFTKGLMDDKPYFIMQRVGTELVCFLAMHPLTTDHVPLKRLRIDTVSGDVIDNDGTLSFNIYEDYTPKAITDFQDCYDQPAGHTFWMMDVAGDANYSYVMIPDMDQSEKDIRWPTGNYKMLRINSIGEYDEFDLGPHGRISPNHGNYFGMAYFAKTLDGFWGGDIYLSRENNDTWTVEKWHFDGESVSKVEDVMAQTSTTKVLLRPMPPYNSNDGGAMVCIENMAYDGYLDWEGELEIF